MLSALAVILFVLWALGMAGSYAVGGLVHLLLFLAFVVIVIDLFQERRDPAWRTAVRRQRRQ